MLIWRSFTCELYLHLGITTVAQIEIYQDGPWSCAQKEGTNLGKIRGPRIWMSGIAIGGARGIHDAFGSRTSRGFRVVTSEEETRRVVRRKKEWGYDCIKINEYLPFELAKATCDEAHRHNMAVAAHSLDAMESARAGVDAIEHIWSVGYSSIPYPPARRKLAEDRLSGKIEQELAGAYYQTENFDRVIDAMVGSNVAWTPTIAKWLRPLSPSAERFRKREREILDNPKANLPDAVRVVTDNAYDKLFRRYTPEQLDMAKIGFEKANEFIYKFVKAGGLLKEGSDPPRGMAALLLHEALVMDVEAGVPPMAAIQAATLNVAKTFKMEKDYGSVEVGKVGGFVHRRGQSAQRYLDDLECEDGRDGWESYRPRLYELSKPDTVFLLEPVVASGHSDIASFSPRRRRTDCIDCEVKGDVAIPYGHAQWPSAADDFPVQGPAASHRPFGRHREGRHLFRHDQEQRRTVA